MSCKRHLQNLATPITILCRAFAAVSHKVSRLIHSYNIARVLAGCKIYNVINRRLELLARHVTNRLSVRWALTSLNRWGNRLGRYLLGRLHVCKYIVMLRITIHTATCAVE